MATRFPLAPSSLSECAQPPARDEEASPRFDRRDGAAIGLLILGVAALFWKELFAGQALFFRDAFNQSYPLAQFIHDVCRHGHMPYWNPLLNFGEPLVANPNSLFFYPDTLLIVLLPLSFAYNFHYVLSFMIAAAGAYCLARRWNQSRWAALFAASAFVFSGPLLSLGSFYNEAACVAWIPWALVATDKAIAERRARPWMVLTAVFALQFLAGELFTLMGTFVLTLAYALYLTRSRPRRAGSYRILAGFIAVAAVTLALSAVEFVPAAHLLAASRRGIQGLAYHDTAYWSLHPLSLIEMALPHFFGNALEGYTTWSWVLNGRNLPYFPSIFLGFVPLFFAFAGWICRPAPAQSAASLCDTPDDENWVAVIPAKAGIQFSPVDPRFRGGDRGHPLGRKNVRRFVAGAAAATLVLVLGSYTPVFALVYLLFPPLGLVRFPVKLLVIFALLVALLAGWGIDAFRDRGTNWARARSKAILPLGCFLALAVATLVCAFAAPELIRWPAERILIATNHLFIYGDARLRLPAAEVHASLGYLLTMIKVHFPGLAGLLLGGIAWLLMMAQSPARGRKALPFVAAFGIFQLGFVNYSANPTVPKAFYAYQPPVLTQVAAPDPPYRIAYVARRGAPGRSASSVQTFLDFSSIPLIAPLPMLAQTAFRDRLVLARGTMVTGRDVIHNTDVDLSIPIDLFDFWIYERDQMPDPGRGDCLLGRANIRYEITPTPEQSPALRETGRIANGSAQPDYLYENRCAMPRAYVASGAIYSSSPLLTLTALSNREFNPAQRVILGDRSGDVLPGSVHAARAPAGRVSMVQEGTSTAVLEAEMAELGYVVLLDHYDPGWTARVDGHDARIHRADLLFQAVKLDPGRHFVRFQYRPPGLAEGVIISCVTLVLLGGVFWLNPLIRNNP